MCKPATTSLRVYGTGDSGPRVAVIQDWLLAIGGSERVLGTILEIMPGAAVYSLICDLSPRIRALVGDRPIQTSFLQHLPGSVRWHSIYLPLMPLAIEALELSEYDLVISSSHAVAKGVRVRSDQLHISYVHTPMRYAWELEKDYLRRGRMLAALVGAPARVILHYLRLWDVLSAVRVDVFVANSWNVARRIWRAYRRHAKVIYPPVDVERFDPMRDREDYYVTVTRLVPYKRVDVVVEAFRQLGRPLVVIGDGPELKRLRKRRPANVRFLGWQPEAVVKEYLERAKAFVFAAEEDFGIAPVEAQAAGTPVIAYGRGGVTESVVPGETGLFFHEQTPEALAATVLEFERKARVFSVERIRGNAERFSKERFKREFSELVEREWERFRRRWRRPGDAEAP